MPVQDKYLKRDKAQIPVPQYFDNDLDDFVPLDNGMYIKEAQVMIPIEKQSNYGETRQMHSAVSIPANTWNASSFIDVSGFDKIFVSVSMTSGTGMTVNVDLSHDGTTFFANPVNILYDGSANYCAFECPVMSKYIRITVKNKDATNPKTTSSYVYLKA